MTEVEWLKERKKSIGTSEVPTVMQCNRWETRLELCCRKRGEIPEKEETEAMRMGHVLEPVIDKLYCDETGRRTMDPGEFALVRNSDWPWLHATPDRIIPATTDNSDGILELKAPGAHMAADWDDCVPLYVQAQLQAQMAVCGLSWGSVAALIGGQHFVWADFERHQGFIDDMLKKTKAFWELVQSGEQPETTEETAAADLEVLRLLYPDHERGKVIQLPDLATAMDHVLQQAKADIKLAEGGKAFAEAKLKALMGDAERGELSTGGAYTWKTVKVSGYTVDAFTKRDFRRTSK